MSKSTMLALYQTALGDVAVTETSIPVPEGDEALVRVHAVALNPYDWKMVYGRSPSTPVILGCDFAGTVEAVGASVQHVKVGDRVAGMIQGGNTLRPSDGAFAQYVAAPAHVLLHLPDAMSFEDGATLPVPTLTAGFCLYRHLGLPYPTSTAQDVKVKERPSILVYGGASSIGLMQIQLSKLGGLRVLTVCSGASSALVRKYGADEVFDYLDPDCERQVKTATQGRVQHVIDCISTPESVSICAAAMHATAGGGTYISCQAKGPGIDNNPSVKTIRIVAFTVLGREFSFGIHGLAAPVVQEDVVFGREFAVVAGRLLADAKLRSLQREVRSGGLKEISGGLDDLKSGRVRGRRLVYQISC